MPRQRGAASVPKQPELVFEQRCGALNAVHSDTASSEFQGECDAIQSAADFGDDRRVLIVQFEWVAAGGNLFDEELHRWEAQRLRCGQRHRIARRTLEWRQMMNPLALRTQRLPAGDQNMNLRCVAEYVLCQRGHGLDDVLAAIEHQQHTSLAKECQDDREGILRNYGEPEVRCK